MSVNLVIEASKRTLETPKSDRAKRERLIEIREKMLPAEAAAREEVDTLVSDLERWERAEQKGKLLGLNILSPEVFSWKKNDLPAFAVFPIAGNGECVLSTDPAKEKLPACCKRFYDNALKEPTANRVAKFFTQNFKTIWCLSALVVEACYFYSAQASASATWGKFLLGLTLGVLASFCASLMCLIVLIAGWTLLVRERERTAWVKFAGTIPETVKRKIALYRSDFKEILILAEAQWNIVEKKHAVKMPACCDPLVLGWDGDFFWIIDRFNTSSIEQLAADEFAVRAENLDSTVGQF